MNLTPTNAMPAVAFSNDIDSDPPVLRSEQTLPDRLELAARILREGLIYQYYSAGEWRTGPGVPITTALQRWPIRIKPQEPAKWYPDKGQWYQMRFRNSEDWTLPQKAQMSQELYKTKADALNIEYRPCDPPAVEAPQWQRELLEGKRNVSLPPGVTMEEVQAFMSSCTEAQGKVITMTATEARNAEPSPESTATAEELRALLADARIRADRAEEGLSSNAIATPLSEEDQAAILAEKEKWDAECKAARREQQRADFAGLAMQALCANFLEGNDWKAVADAAVEMADALLAALEAPKS